MCLRHAFPFFFCEVVSVQMANTRETALLTARLEASERLHRIHELEAVVARLEQELKESNELLRAQRLPRRPYTNATQKQLIAASQGWRCAGVIDGPPCPLILLNNGLFDGALYVIDHTSPYCTSGRHEGNRTALCPYCDSVKTRREIASRAYKQGRRDESDGEESE